MRMDWEKEAGQEFMVYPTDDYRVIINGYEETTAKTGTPQIRWKTSIIEPAEFAGKPLTIHTALTQASLWRIAQLVRGCGISLKELGAVEVRSPAFFRALDSCVRRTTIWRVIKTKDNKDRDKNEVQEFLVDENQDKTNVIGEEVPDFLKE